MKNILRIISVIFISVLFAACGSDPEPPGPDSEKYRQAVSDFFVSLAAAQTDEARFAFNKMNDVARAYPQEAAAWANLGVYAMRQGNFDLAEERMAQARETAPGNSDILYVSGMMESRRGNVAAAIDFYRQASEAEPENLRIRYSLLSELERQDASANAEEINRLLSGLLQDDPQNLVLALEQARIASRDRNISGVNNALDLLEDSRDMWDEEAVEQFEVVREVAGEEAFSELTFELTFFRNTIEPLPVFQDDLRRIEFPPTEVGFLLTRFTWLPEPVFRAADPDFGVSFTHQQPDLPEERAALVRPVTLLEESPPFTVAIVDGELVIDPVTRLPFPGSTDGPLSPAVLAEIDYNYNFKNDIALAGDSGFRLYRQEEDESFTDISGDIGIPASVRNGAYHGVWPADVDLDGDLDLILSPQNAPPFALINRTDGTFGVAEVFDGITDVLDLRWADLDGDGAADALFLDGEGSISLFRNFRSNDFRKEAGFPDPGNVAAIAIGDLSANGFFEILAARESGEITGLYYNSRYDRWDKKTVIPAGELQELSRGETTVFVADLDNNGSFDIVVSGFEFTSILLSDSDQRFELLDTGENFGRITGIFDVDGNERLDLIGSGADGMAFNRMNQGSKPYHAYSIRARASGLEGDQRINSFGIGGEMEIRSGLLYQKQLISSPILHFGLGEYEEAEMLRIIWPNGSVQAEFAEMGMGSTIFNEQVLKGSCPWLFTNDGEEVHFITDILWRSPLGLRINAQETAGVIQTLDRVRIPSDKLKPVDGIYDIRVTAELWETHFFDYVGLIAVDHPEDTEVFIDERFVFPAPDLSAVVTTTPSPVVSVRDDSGNDLTETVSRADGNYIAPFRKTSYQGLVHEHSIEIDLGYEIPADAEPVLLAHGWLRPTDSSINLALSQGDHQPPSGLKIEVRRDGEWQVLHDNYGIPAGKTKTIVIDLEDAFSGQDENRLRFTTTSEIYWDAIWWAEKKPASAVTKQKLAPFRQDLRYRGFSEWSRADSISPKLPDYAEIASTNQRWRDLIGYHTRFGDVSELLADIDDRYVIMNAGDEMVLEFKDPGAPQPGYKRSFIFVSDGWVKDGDYNTEASKTVIPLPYHGQSDYDYGREMTLQQDPVYQMHRKDWKKFHTRYITPEPFRTALILQD